ncbi:MAG: holo-ACP synthase [Dehalococcoidia bacterium]|nr:holo-ACP synthase [Dehalococcoidia bacterium]
MRVIVKDVNNSVGVDIIEIPRVAEAVTRWGERFLNRIYTPLEVAFCRGRLPELAARFAAKEAVSKALGTGMRGVAWKEIEIIPDRKGKPHVRLHGQAKRRADELGLTHFAISLSHTREYAIAFVTATGEGDAGGDS